MHEYVAAGLHAKGSTVAIMAPPGRHYIEGTWGSWLNGQIAVPLCLSHPARSVSCAEYASLAVSLSNQNPHCT